MPTQKQQKIDLSAEYPCPCRRKGKLKPILLTDAFGCDRCQQIFVVDESGRRIEQLSATYPYKRSWRWTGHRWVLVRTPMGEHYIPAFGILGLLVLMGSLLILRSGFSFLVMAILVVLLLIVPAFVFWLSYRR